MLTDKQKSSVLLKTDAIVERNNVNNEQTPLFLVNSKLECQPGIKSSDIQE